MSKWMNEHTWRSAACRRSHPRRNKQRRPGACFVYWHGFCGVFAVSLGVNNSVVVAPELKDAIAAFRSVRSEISRFSSCETMLQPLIMRLTPRLLQSGSMKSVLLPDVMLHYRSRRGQQRASPSPSALLTLPDKSTGSGSITHRANLPNQTQPDAAVLRLRGVLEITVRPWFHEENNERNGELVPVGSANCLLEDSGSALGKTNKNVSSNPTRLNVSKSLIIY